LFSSEVSSKLGQATGTVSLTHASGADMKGVTGRVGIFVNAYDPFALRVSCQVHLRLALISAWTLVDVQRSAAFRRG